MSFEKDSESPSDWQMGELPNNEAAALGTVLHEWLELIHDCPHENWSPARIEESVDAIRSGLVRAEAPAGSVEELTVRCLALLRNFLFERGWLDKIRVGQESGSWSELPLLERQGNGIRQHIIDRMVRTPRGEFEIMDYKTSPANVASSQKWNEQLERYRRLIEKLGIADVSRTEIIVFQDDPV